MNLFFGIATKVAPTPACRVEATSVATRLSFTPSSPGWHLMRHTPGIVVTTHVGQDILPVVDELAGLRIPVFCDWPYLYDGDRDYERGYLAAYAASPRSVCVVARTEAGQVVGASTGIPLADDGEATQAPFLSRGVDVDDVFYFGESVLLAEWRGRGVGHAFFDARRRMRGHAAASAGRLSARYAAIRPTRVRRLGIPRPTRPSGAVAVPPGRHGLHACHGEAPRPISSAARHNLDFWMRAIDRAEAPA